MKVLAVSTIWYVYSLDGILKDGLATEPSRWTVLTAWIRGL